tara:strand:+ start:751 stop:1608 length:858 start_codon:yes stop_codon:yes gene_type:complete
VIVSVNSISRSPAGKSSHALNIGKENTQRRHNVEPWIPTHREYITYSSIKAADQLKQGKNLQSDATGMCFTKAKKYVEKNNLATMHLRDDGHIIVVERIDEKTCLVLSFGQLEPVIELTKNQLLVKPNSDVNDEHFLWQGDTIKQSQVNNGKTSNVKKFNLNQKLSYNDLTTIAKSYFEKQKKAIYVRTYPQNLHKPDPNTAFKLFVKFDFENPNERITVNIKCGRGLPEMIAAFSDQDIRTQGIKRLFSNLNHNIKRLGLHEDTEFLNQLQSACQIYNVYDELG